MILNNNIIFKNKDTCYVVDLWNSLKDKSVLDTDIRSIEKNTFEYDFICDYYRYIVYFKETIQFCYENEIDYFYNPRRPSIENRTEYIEDAIAYTKCIQFMDKEFKIKKSEKIQKLKTIIENDLDFYYLDYILTLKELNSESFDEIKKLECEKES